MTFQNSFGEIFNVFQKHWDDFLGDCKVPTKHINRRVWHSRIWSLIKFLDVLLRSIGEVRQVTCENFKREFIYYALLHIVDCICEQSILWSSDPCFYLHRTYKSWNWLCSRG